MGNVAKKMRRQKSARTAVQGRREAVVPGVAAAPGASAGIKGAAAASAVAAQAKEEGSNTSCMNEVTHVLEGMLPSSSYERRGAGPNGRGSSPNRGGPSTRRGGGWPVRGRGGSNPRINKHQTRSEPAVITKLQTVNDWTNLSNWDSTSRVLTKLQTLEESWVKSLQTDAPVEVLDLAFDIFSKLGLKYFYAKVSLMKSLFTYDFVMRLTSIVKEFKTTWRQKGTDKVRAFIKNLQTNMKFVLSYVVDPHEMKTVKVALDVLINECVATLIHLRGILLTLESGTSGTELQLEIAAVTKLREVEFAETVVEESPHPTDFMNPLVVDANIVQGAYLSKNHYIQTHFNLLKEDFQTVLREGVEQYLANPKKKNFSIWSYENSVIKRSFAAKQNKAMERKLLFEVTFPGRKKYFSQINWMSVKRFMFGSLVVLTADNFTSYHLAVVEDTCLKNPDAISVTISFIFSPPHNVEGMKFLLVEPKAFYEPYVNSMKVLKHMSEVGLPLEKYIVKADTNRVLPSYLKPGSTYEIGGRHVRVGDRLSWSKVQLGLNPSQKEAFINALTSEMALIQGPPGTGKTFLSFKIIEAILKNRPGDGPIMVVCYKNHSLDQILEGLLKNGIRVLRMGSGSKNPALDEYNYRSLKTPFLIGHILHEKRFLEARLKKLMNDIYKTTSLINLIKAQIGILSSDLLQKFEVIPRDFHVSLEEWLLEFEAPQLSLVDIEQIRIGFANFEAYKNIMSSDFEINLLSVSEAVIGNNSILSDLEEMLRVRGMTEETMVQFWEINEEYSRTYALCCSLVYGIRNFSDPADTSVSRSVDPSQMEIVDRWALYREWESKLVERLEIEVHNLQNQVPEIECRLSEYDEMTMSLKIKHSGAQVIGLTTTRASKHFSALADVGVKVVLVEEAAEVLEANVITSLSSKCQHLILIGDHQQLKPSTASYELATKYHMDVSLFERMIKNDMEVSSLATQHRMRPEIAALICPSIYKNLANHQSVQEYPDVFGTKKNVYFFDHNHQEETDNDSESKSNPKEAEMVTAIAKYLLMQGYPPDKITILSTYMDQDRKIKKIIDKQYAGTELKKVLCTVVDNYQGEENIIILLSLVRSNHYGDIGFLKTKNRICVALSRAKHGLFIFGNMSCLTKKKPEIWDDIKNVVVDQDAISTKFPLKCLRHGNITEVTSPEEVEALKNGGCIHPCDTALTCGHTCRVMCHSLDREHAKEFTCRDRCLKKCENGHTCPALCQDKCPPCPAIMPKLLVCGHTKKLKCHLDNLQSYCTEDVPFKLELCGHSQLVCCRLTVPSKKSLIKCHSKCEKAFSCGHVCGRRCHVLEDPDHEQFQCEEACELVNESCPQKHKCKRKCREPCGRCLVEVKKSLPCGHIARMHCAMGVEEFICREDCSKKLPCGHDCANICVAPCGPCELKVEKVIDECGHKIRFRCHGTPTRKDCIHPCKTMKSCGHKCSGKCSKTCEEVFCKTPTKVKLPCGHFGVVPCGEQEEKTNWLDFTTECTDRCQTKLPCGHSCKGTCGSCLQGRVHIPCDEICDKILLCSHKCQARCSDSYHSCRINNKKCFKTCWGSETNFPPGSSKQGRGKNKRTEFNQKTQMANETRNALIAENAKMLKMAQNYSANESIALHVKQIQLLANKSRTIDISKNDEGLLALRTSLFKVEFVSNVLRIIKCLESAALPSTKAFELEQFLEALVVRSASSQLGTYEMTQLQEQIVWVSLVLDVCDFSPDHNIKDRMLRETKSPSGPSDRANVRKKLCTYGKSAGISDLVLTGVELKGLFPAADRFCGPIVHHADKVQERERQQKEDEEPNELVYAVDEKLLIGE